MKPEWPKCDKCGRFVGAGSTSEMRYSGFPPHPDHEDFRCAKCSDKFGPLSD